jgi:hypothetical protein
MWVFLTARFRQFVIFSVALPVLRSVSRRVADRIERSHGRTRTTRALRTLGGSGGRRGRRGR